MSVLYLDFGNSRFKWRLSDGGITAQSYEGFDAWLHSLSGHGDLTAVVFASVLTERRQEGITEQLKSALSLPLQRCVVTRTHIGASNGLPGIYYRHDRFHSTGHEFEDCHRSCDSCYEQL